MEGTSGGDSTATARAHSNIALAKYWGKRDARLNIPAVGSLSVTLDGLYTDTTVTFEHGLRQDELWLNGQRESPDHPGFRRVATLMELVRSRASTEARARIVSTNNFPTGAGLASSASGFAALAVAACAASGVEQSQRQLSLLARRGSASAARSIFGGYVELHTGSSDDGEDAFAEPLMSADDWPLSVVVAITEEGAKAVSSTEGMSATSASSVFYRSWLENSEDALDQMRAAVLDRDLERVGELAESSCLAMHALMLTTRPALLYWNAATMSAIHAVRAMRGEGTPVYFTIDAGPQVKALCRQSDADTVSRTLSAVPGVRDVRTTGLGPAAHLVAAS